MAGKFHIDSAGNGGQTARWRDIRAYDEGYRHGVAGGAVPPVYGADAEANRIFLAARMKGVSGDNPGFVAAPP